jgi:hypothetical protein
LWSFAYAAEKDLRQLRAEHFIINYDEDVSVDYVYEVKNISEDLYRIITQEFRLVRNEFWLGENRAKIFIAKNQDDYLSRFNCPSWSSACVDYKEKLIYTYPNQEKFNSILVHELTHIIFREYVGMDKLPLWLDEGIAAYMEEKHSKPRLKRDVSPVGRAIKDNSYIRVSDLNKITFSDIKGKDQDYVNLFYLESFSIVSFLIEKYSMDSFSQVSYFLRKGHSCQQAIYKAIYSLRTWEDLEAQWKKFYQE